MAGDESGRPVLRSNVIRSAVEQTVLGMGEMGLTPQEAMTSAELILWQFMENAMKSAANDEMQRMAKLVCSRVLIRMTSRVEAWPALTTERM